MKAVVLTATQYGSDSSYMVSLFTEEAGSVSASVHIGGKKSKIKRVHLAPLTLLDVELSGREKSEVKYIGDCRVYRICDGIAGNILKVLESQLVAEALRKVLRYEHGDAKMYEFIEKSIIELDEMRDGVEDWHLKFLVQLMERVGISPDVSDYREGDVLDLIEGKSVRYSLGESLDPEMTLAVVKLMRGEGIESSQRAKMVDFIEKYYQLHLEGFGKLKSLEVLREL